MTPFVVVGITRHVEVDSFKDVVSTRIVVSASDSIPICDNGVSMVVDRSNTGNWCGCDGPRDTIVLGNTMCWFQFALKHGVMGPVAFLSWVGLGGRVLNGVSLSGGVEGVCSFYKQTTPRITQDLSPDQGWITPPPTK
ncbi:glycoprotein N [Macropodid alphaherpesvirus 2]|uniref:Glycoprotein N n=1 Tax=Macropodid alphaherpesvirus 2 TaxID=83440 RepID=A0AAE7MLP2_9ALPH|nr:glycoprotein N [Macropodid alphaherpesvirus 2]QOD40252.1 glycoprotein N [Macropodid alphaherpesvirus 2]WGO49715.1 glycoprotein N [Macropodid alphaherpesvirus 2]